MSGISGNECWGQLATSVMNVGGGSGDTHGLRMYEGRGQATESVSRWG